MPDKPDTRADRRFWRGIPISVAALAMAATTASAQPVNGSFYYQGYLEDNGIPVDDQYDFRFRLYTSPTGGTLLQQFDVGEVTVEDGIFSAAVSFNPTFFDGSPRYLHVGYRPAELGINYTFLNPLSPVLSAPYATRAITADSVVGIDGHSLDAADGSPANAVFVNNAGNVGINQTNPLRPLHIGNFSGPNESLIRIVSAGGGGARAWDMGVTGDSFDLSERYNFIIDDTGTAATDFSVQIATGNVGIGTNNPVAKLDVRGGGQVDVLTITGGSDISEPYNISGDPEPGMVVSIDPARVGQLMVSDTAFDTKVAGIVSGAGGVGIGLSLTHEGTVADGDQPVAMAGRVWTWCDADANGPITAGDLLTTSATPGHAMRVGSADAGGATVGKAMSSLESGRGLVLVLINLQ